jgi:hypothetical protein
MLAPATLMAQGVLLSRTPIRTLSAFNLLYTKECGRFGLLPNFENHAFNFSRQ